ncbi:MAG TPA: hypothetical protein VFU72_16415, partial [Nitrolancea sp.]|nr:hypothetical protein [Nitrolancea sp.]
MPTPAGGPRRYSPELAVSLRIASDVQLAPDGARVAWVVAPVGHEETRPTSTIWLAEVGPEPAPRPFTGGKAEDRMPRWAPDGGRLAFLSDRATRGSAQIYLIDRQGGEAQPLGALPGAADLLAWLPDGSALSCTITRRALAGEQESSSEIKVASQSDRPQTIVRVPLDGGAPAAIGPAEGH